MTPVFLKGADGVGRGLIRHSAPDSMCRVEVEQEEDGRWLSEITDLPGVMAYGTNEQDAVRRALALALRVVAERIEHDEHDLTSGLLAGHTGLKPSHLLTRLSLFCPARRRNHRHPRIPRKRQIAAFPQRSR